MRASFGMLSGPFALFLFDDLIALFISSLVISPFIFVFVVFDCIFFTFVFICSVESWYSHAVYSSS